MEVCPLVQEYRARMPEYRTSSLPMAIQCDPRMEAEARNNFQVTLTYTAEQCRAASFKPTPIMSSFEGKVVNTCHTGLASHRKK